MNKARLLAVFFAPALLARADLLPPAQDSSSLKGKLTTATGRAATLSVNALRKGFVLFNVESLPPDVQAADIANARLRIYFPSATKPGDIAVHTVQQAWMEEGTAPEPPVSASPVGTIPAAAVVGKQFVEVDVTATVQAWRTDPTTNFGFAFLADGHTSVTIGAKEGSGSGYPAELDLEIGSASVIAVGSVGSAQLAPNLSLLGNTSGAFYGTFAGNLSGTATSANFAFSANNLIGNFAGDITGTQSATIVKTVWGESAANVAAGAILANHAIAQSVPNAIVKRTQNGDFAGSTIIVEATLSLPQTAAAGIGTITQAGSAVLHTFGANNVFVGRDAGNFSLNGQDNTAIGPRALRSITSGYANAAIGSGALSGDNTGFNNAALGHHSLFNNQSGYDNIGVGVEALYSNTNGHDNTALGTDALVFNTGSDNIALGANAGGALTTGNNNIDIGNTGVAGESNTTRIGTTEAQTATFIAGISGVTVSGGAAVSILANGQLGTVTSSRRFKDNIRPMGDSSNALLKLNPVTFTYKEELDPKRIPQWGLIAEEVAAVNPDWVVLDEKGGINTVRYEQINAMLLNEFLKEHRRAKDVEKTLREENAALKERLERIEARLGMP